MDEIAVTLTIFTYVIKHLTSENPTHDRSLRPRYLINTRISDQVLHLHRLVSISDESCLRKIRMDRNAFGRLSYLLEYSGGILQTKHLTVPEQVVIFLCGSPQ